MLIKFLPHGKGSASKAASYVLDNVNHLNQERAGVKVLTGDSITFTSICDANPNLWKYTSAVIAWSKEDNPTDQQINEVLQQFEKHAFSGLEAQQYHMFSTLHIEEDGSKHIHILVPRLELESGKALNIAPPGHEKYYDPLRDHFNHKYNWSRPDDPLRLETTQTPSYVSKIEAQAQKILEPEKLKTLKKKDFCSYVDNYVKSLLRLEDVKTRHDIAECLRNTKGIKSVKEGKNYLSVTLNEGKTHRLRGDFYNDKFEIGVYREYLQSAKYNRQLSERTQQIASETRELCLRVRRTRYDYHRQNYPSRSTNISVRGHIEQYSERHYNLEPNRTKGFYEPSSKYQGRDRQFGNDSENITTTNPRKSEQRNQLSRKNNFDTQEQNREYSNQSGEFEQTTSISSAVSNNTSISQDQRVGDCQNRNSTDGTYEKRKITLDTLRSDGLDSVADTFKFLADVSNSYQRDSYLRTKSRDIRECREYQTTKYDYSRPDQIQEINHAERDRLLLELTARAVEERKRITEATESRIRKTEQCTCEYERRMRSNHQWISETERFISQSDQDIAQQQGAIDDLFRNFTKRVFETTTGAVTTATGNAETDLEISTRRRNPELNPNRPNSGINRDSTRETYYTFSTELFEREKQNNRLSKQISGFSNETLYSAITKLKQRKLNRKKEQRNSYDYGVNL